MVHTTMRFNLTQPGIEPTAMAERYRAFVELAGYGEEHGISGVSVEEHHGAANGWSPSPLALAGLVFGRTTRMTVFVGCMLAPLHDPVRIAEDIAVLDLASGGRLTTVLGIGYRPEEYALYGKDWAARGALMDEFVDTLLQAWRGETFARGGHTVRVTPLPVTQPHPPIFLGGSSKPAARRAARFGLPMFAPGYFPWLEEYYREQCALHGTTPVFRMPTERTPMVHVADDPDRVWAELGHHFLEEAVTYRSWQTVADSSAAHSDATTVDELRADGLYQVLTPDECVERLRSKGEHASLSLHPLVGGMPVAEAWSSVRSYVEQVLPRV